MRDFEIKKCEKVLNKMLEIYKDILIKYRDISIQYNTIQYNTFCRLTLSKSVKGECPLSNQMEYIRTYTLH